MLRLFRNLSEYRSKLLRAPQWIWSLRYPLFPSFQAARLRHLVSLRPGEWLLTEVIVHSETHGSSSSSSNPAAALFHRLHLVLLLPGSGGVLGLSHELIIVKIIIGLESLASGFHI
jgi:hypothetical protein